MKCHWRIIPVLWLLVISCSHSRIDHDQTARNQSNADIKAPPIAKPRNEIDEETLNRIAQENGLRLFAWGVDEHSGIKLAGLDRKSRLSQAYLKKTDNGYSTEILEDYSLTKGHNTALVKSGALNLSDHITDREIPFTSNIISIGECQTHFVLVSQAVVRSLDSTNPVRGPVIEPALRIIVTTGSDVVSNNLIEQRNLSITEAFTRDVTGDRKKEYVLMDSESYEHLQIWRVEEGCSVKQIEFKDLDNQPGGISARGLWLERTRDNRGYEIHAIYPEPITIKNKVYIEETLSTYKWDKQQMVYKKVKEFKRIKKG
jgi:hypothetical protein